METRGDTDVFHERIDITGEVCPMTYVRVKLRLEAMAPGQTLEVLLVGDEPRRNVPRSAAADGHEVVALEAITPMTTRLVLRVGGSDDRRRGPSPRPGSAGAGT